MRALLPKKHSSYVYYMQEQPSNMVQWCYSIASLLGLDISIPSFFERGTGRFPISPILVSALSSCCLELLAKQI
jgi:hypothetical protein